MLTLPAPGKVNLSLKVLGQREDGYHRICSVMTFINWCDVVQVSARKDGQLRLACSTKDLHSDDNLCLQAARLLAKHCQCEHLGADIRLLKRLPVGAGLGGGSSDAATVLLGLNQLWGTGQNLESLAVLGAQLGADVPFFVRGETSFAEGIGDLLTPVRLRPQSLIVLYPDIVLQSGDIYRQLSEMRSEVPETPTTEHPATAYTALQGNDLAEAALAFCPELATTWEWFSRWGEVFMSGSGSALFIDTEGTNACMAEVLAQAPPPNWQLALMQTQNRSSLHIALTRYSKNSPKQPSLPVLR